MGMALRPETRFKSPEAEEFRAQVLAGCRRLSVEELRELADDIHECARMLRHTRGGLANYGNDPRNETIRSFSPRSHGI